MKSSLLLVSLICGVYGQYEDRKNIPVETPESHICKDVSDPVITHRPEPLYRLNLGDPIKITCGASGIPMPYVYWIKGKKDMTDKEKRVPVTAVGQSVLYIPEIEADDVDYYTCVVEDCCKGTIQRMETEIQVKTKAQCTKKQGAGYLIVWEFKNWTDAHEFCKSRNMEFAVPKNEELNKRLHDKILETLTSDPNGKKFAHHNMVWMGMTDGVEETDFVFTDINTMQPIEYDNWLNKQPDNWKKYDKVGQDVIAMHRISGKWDDSYGFWKRPFACWCPPKGQKGAKRG